MIMMNRLLILPLVVVSLHLLSFHTLAIEHQHRVPHSLTRHSKPTPKPYVASLHSTKPSSSSSSSSSSSLSSKRPAKPFTSKMSKPPIHTTIVRPRNLSQFCGPEFSITSIPKCARFEFSYVHTNTGKDEPCVASPPANLTELSFPSPDPALANMSHASLSPMIRRIIEGITNTFENGTPEYAYGKCEHLDDGRGYTCGRIGFTTGTGDALWVVERYVQQRGSNNTALARYLPELRRLAALPNCDMNGKESIQHLEGFPAAWTMADQQDTKLFRHIQDSINEEHYLVPALKFAHKHGVTTPLGQAIFYDTVVQHGYAVTEDNIDLQRVITLTGARHANETETQWLDRFLVTRGQMLCCFPDSVWPASADRVHDLRELLRRGQLNLKGNITLGSSGIQILATADNSTTPSEDLRASAIKIRRLPSHNRNTSRKMALLPSRGHRRLSSTSKHT